MESESPFQIKATIEFLFTSEKICSSAYNSFLPELDLKSSRRSKISMEKQENSLLFRVESSDITAFRASINEIIGLGKVIDSTHVLIRKS